MLKEATPPDCQMPSWTSAPLGPFPPGTRVAFLFCLQQQQSKEAVDRGPREPRTLPGQADTCKTFWSLSPPPFPCQTKATTPWKPV